jgi:hypothetical protein
MMDLGPGVARKNPDYRLCRTRPMKSEYRECLGNVAAVRKETVVLQGDNPDKARFARIMSQFGAAHGMAFQARDAWSGNPVPAGTNLCAAGKAFIVASPLAPTYGFPPSTNPPRPWRMPIAIYVPAGDRNPDTTVEAFVSTLESEWPGIARSDLDIDFCRAVKER